jgi:hypothetical protein
VPTLRPGLGTSSGRESRSDPGISRFSNASEKDASRRYGAVMGRPWASAGSLRARASVPWGACVLRLPTSGTRRPSALRTWCRSMPRRLPCTVLSGVRRCLACTNRQSCPSRFTCKSQENREPTTDSNRLPLLQLRVITQALQGFAHTCESRMFSRFSFL